MDRLDGVRVLIQAAAAPQADPAQRRQAPTRLLAKR